MKDSTPGKPGRGGSGRPIEFGLDQSGLPYAFVRDQVVLRIPNDEVAERVRGEMRGRAGRLEEWRLPARFGVVQDVDDALDEAAFWNRMGVHAQPNHVLFATAGEVHGNPAMAVGATGATFGNPSAAGATFGNPWGSFCNPCCPPPGGEAHLPPASGPPGAPRRNLAVPVTEKLDRSSSLSGTKPCRVVVLDTGLSASQYLPADFGNAATPLHVVTPTAPGRPETDQPDETGDSILDPVSGHGTFIAGLLKRIAPEATVEVVRVLSTLGEGDDGDIATAIDKVRAERSDVDILSLSFSGYTKDDRPPIALADAIERFQGAGGVVVASAGNDATSRVGYPAGLPNVVSVGALGPNGPAPFTNYGRWVRACAPGMDVVSRFYSHRSRRSTPNLDAIKAYAGWASWSGTSFSAPIVAGVIARTVCREKVTPQEAVSRCIDDPRLLRLPGLGTVINEH